MEVGGWASNNHWCVSWGWSLLSHPDSAWYFGYILLLRTWGHQCMSPLRWQIRACIKSYRPPPLHSRIFACTPNIPRPFVRSLRNPGLSSKLMLRGYHYSTAFSRNRHASTVLNGVYPPPIPHVFCSWDRSARPSPILTNLSIRSPQGPGSLYLFRRSTCPERFMDIHTHW